MITPSCATPTNLMNTDQYVFFIAVLVLYWLYAEHKRIRAIRYDLPAWGSPVKNDKEFIARVLHDCKEDDRRRKSYIRQAVLLFTVGTVIASAALWYGIHALHAVFG